MARSFTRFSWIISGVLSVAVALNADSRDSELSAVLVGPTFTVTSGTVNGVGANTVAYNCVNDEYFVVWTDWHVAAGGSVNQNDIYGQRVAADGGFVGGILDLYSDSSGKFEPSLVHDPIHNQYLVTWHYQGGPPGSPGFNHAYGRVIAATGSAITAPQDYPAPGAERTMAFNPGAGAEGEFLFLGRSFATDSPSGIYHQRVSSAGAAAGAVMVASDGAVCPSRCAGVCSQAGSPRQTPGQSLRQEKTPPRGRGFRVCMRGFYQPPP